MIPHAVRMISCSELRHVAPAVIDPILQVLRRTGIGILGTLRADGSPRVSPIEVSIQDGDLFVGMMPGSRKALDVTRDPRVCLLTPVADREDLGGEGKLFGRLLALSGDDAEARLAAAAADAGFDPELVRGSPSFELRVDGAAWQRVDGDAWTTLSWRLGGPVRLRHRVGATGMPVEVPLDQPAA